MIEKPAKAADRNWCMAHFFWIEKLFRWGSMISRRDEELANLLQFLVLQVEPRVADIRQVAGILSIMKIVN
jgi:hypothetical protein